VPKKKGKHRATDQTNSDGGGGNRDAGDHNQADEDCDDGDNIGDDDNSHTRYISGPLSEEAQEAVRKLGEDTKARADDLARKYRKSPNSIMRMAGLAIQNSHQRQNIANKHKTWYSNLHPRPTTSQ